MGKLKIKKGNFSENLNARKSNKLKKINPFEVQINKEKFQVIGKVTKNDKGLPGVSRGKANTKRKLTLGQEYMNRNKNNKFKDRRLGKINMTNEDIANARFTAERLQQFQSKKQSIYNLNDDEILTHKGQTVQEIENFPEPDNSDDSDEGQLDDEFTRIAHFGSGGLDDAANRKAAIDDLIIESKIRKAERVKEKSEMEDLTAKLDENWKNLIPIMGKLTRNDDDKPKPDAYDRTMREMIFERRGEPTDRLISVEELAKNERDRLEKLEELRLKRMRGTVEKKVQTHRSADDLDDGYCLDKSYDVEEGAIAYDINEKIDKALDVESLDEDDEEDENIENCNENEESEIEDNLDDLKHSSESEEEEEKEVKVKKKDKIKMKTKKEKQIMNDAAKELPYTFIVPKQYEDFKELLIKRTINIQNLIIERMIKTNHPRTAQEGKDKVNTILAYLLQYINDLFTDATVENIHNCFKIVDKFSPHLFDITQLIPELSFSCFKEIIKEKQMEYRKKTNLFPGIETLIFFKIISLLFPTSDYRHPVVTPSLVFISEILTKCSIKKCSDISKGLFLTALALEYSTMSKRFLPSALNFIVGILHLAIHKRPIQTLKIIPPFKTKGPLNSLLVLTDDEIKIKFNDALLMKGTDLITNEITYDFKIRSLGIAIELCYDFCKLLELNVGITYFTATFLNYLDKLSIENYPNKIQFNLKKTIELINTLMETSQMSYLVTERKHPKALRLIEPKVETNYGVKTPKPMSNVKEEREKMLHKIKRETKGAIREIRRDNAFIAKLKIKQQIESDAERREKVKRIFSEASVQQSEINAFDRSNKRKK